jgi:putative glycerol-1-phosphate prenyltransferase
MFKTDLLKKIESMHNGLAILVDPDKFVGLEKKEEWIRKINFLKPDFLFIGGSVVAKNDFDKCIELLHAKVDVPLIIFPGNYDQIHPSAQGLLFLSLLSGQNPEYLITQHVKAVDYLEGLDIEILPTAYLLIDGGIQTAVAYVSQTQPIPQYGKSIAAKISLAGKYQGKKLIYLDAGSGAKSAVPLEMIVEVKKVGLPLIVGGGIKTIDDIKKNHSAGANIVVIGNKIEEDVDFLMDLAEYRSARAITTAPLN